MEERTMTFSINGDFITRLAREKCHYEGKMEYAINLLESCLESDEITDNERKGLAFAILDGRAEITGHIPGDDYRFHYLDQRDERWNVAKTLEKLHERAEQAEKELHQVEEKLGFVASGYMSSWERREAQKQYREETGEKLFANMEEESESTGSALLDSFIKRMETGTDDDYGWLEPNGTFHPGRIRDARRMGGRSRRGVLRRRTRRKAAGSTKIHFIRRFSDRSRLGAAA